MPAVLSFSDHEQLELANTFDVLLFLGYKWCQIATYLDVSISTINRYRKRINYVERLSSVTDEELDKMTLLFIANHPETGNTIDVLINSICLHNILQGAVMLQGEFAAHGFKVSKERILRSLHRVDEEGCQRRKHRCLRRCLYSY